MIHAHVKLGRVAPSLEQQKRALHLVDYMKKPLPPAPASCDHITGAPIAMWANDRLGDCTIAGMANEDAIASKIEGRPCLCTEAAVVHTYFGLTGGEDTGLVEFDVLTQATRQGLQLGGPEPMKLAAWVKVPVHNTAARSSLIAIFGALYLGVALPAAAQNQQIWTGPPNLQGSHAPGSWGGHCLLEGGYDATHRYLVTWGAKKLCDELWLRAYCDEAYVLLDERRAEMAGVDWRALLADLKNVPTS